MTDIESLARRLRQKLFMDLSSVWNITYNVLLVILGINALIIVHEFGHFAVARMCGVRCDKFYIWFDFWGLKFFKFKYGQTEYGLGLFPFGGYVKMLGQEDNPGELRKEIEKAKQTAAGETENNDTVKKLEESIFAPDSYLAKSVPQRLAIIVAGVVMNFIFAMICASAAYLYGFSGTAPHVGSVVSGSPAWEAGLQTGDKITDINGKRTYVFADINMSMVGGKNGVKLNVDRNGSKKEITIVPRKRRTDLSPMIGVGSLPSLQVIGAEREIAEVKKDVFSGKKNTQSGAVKVPANKKVFIRTVNGQEIKTYTEYLDVLLKNIDKPIDVELTAQTAALTLVPKPMKEIPVRFKMGTIVSVLPGSDAEKKGIKVGDTIVSVDGDKNIDPLKLPQQILNKLNEGKNSVDLEISGQILSVSLAPVRNIPELLSMRDSVGSTALGLAWNVENVLETGEKITGVEIRNTKPLLRKTSFSETTPDGILIKRIGEKIDIPYIFTCLLQDAVPADTRDAKQSNNVVSIRLYVENKDGKTELRDFPIQEAKDWFNTERGLFLAVEETQVKVTDFGEACRLGTLKMIDSSLAVYHFLKGLFNGNVSPRALGGPIAIVQIAYDIVGRGLGQYLMFLCLIGANLAVINILPMPPLDGGHVVFLVYEGIFRRQPNEIVQVVLSYVGLFLILLLMIWALSLDLSCIPRL